MNGLQFVRILVINLFIQNSYGFLEGWWKKGNTVVRNEKFTSYLTVNEQEIDIIRYDNFSLVYTIRGDYNGCVTLTVNSSEAGIVILPDSERVCNNTKNVTFNFGTYKEGITTIQIGADPPSSIDTSEVFTSVSVKIEEWIDTLGDVIGWLYTIAWDISFLPQIVHNWQRQSVIGLSFDFLTFNLIGFTCYSFFNIGLYWIPSIQAEYKVEHPNSILHVRLNDVIFPLYAVLCTVVQLIQCFIYERGNQRVSIICRIISGLLLTSAVVYMILVGAIDDILWLDFLYWLSYIKLAITCIKYTPQIYENYRLKSTEGWSIGQVSLDFTGGSLSLIQMFLLGFNYDDMHSVLTDPTKLGLGLLSIFFNIIFFIQHFILYRHNKIQKDDKNVDIEIEKEKEVEKIKEDTYDVTVF